ncbi:MAG: hypothetical protein JWM86_1312 [Thermoleophilia bacterium]|nr:hypothetical protein [Thermoleophilia bacterium]
MTDAGSDTPAGGAPRPPANERPEPILPQELVHALGAAPEARARFDALAPSHRREYVTWVAEARRADTRERRAAQTVMRLLERR